MASKDIRPDSMDTCSDVECRSEDAESKSFISPLKLLPTPKRKQTTDWQKCLLCQTYTKELLSKASSKGIASVKYASEKWDDGLDNVLEFYETSRPGKQIKWHRSCFSCYTNKTNIDRHANSQLEGASGDGDGVEIVSRSTCPAIDWSLCLFCQKLSYKKDKTTHQVVQKETEQTIKECAKEENKHGNTQLFRQIEGKDLIFNKARYHRNCLLIHTKKKTSKRQLNLDTEEKSETVETTESLHSQAFQKFLSEIDSQLMTEGKAFTMKYLLERFNSNLPADHVETYNTNNLRKRLESHYGAKIIIQPEQGQGKSSFVYSSSIKLADAIKVAVKLKKELRATQMESDFIQASSDVNEIDICLYHAACIIRSDLKKCVGISCNPLTVTDVSNEKARSILPDNVYKLLRMIIEGGHEEGCIDSKKLAIHRRILSMGQDLLHSVSNGEVRTPKHVGLSCSVRHLTGSKEVVRLLNRLGHAVSYDELERIDTAIAEHQLEQVDEDGVMIPSNIYPQVFVQFAADNDDINEETLDGKHTTHATTMVIYQRKAPVQGTFGPASDKKQMSRRRSLKELPKCQTILDFNCHGRRPNPKDLLGHVPNQWFKDIGRCTVDAYNLDLTWMLLRLCPQKIFDVTLEPITDQKIPAWTAFNAVVSQKIPDLTSIGYCPMFPASPTQYNTVYTVMKTTQKICAKLGQDHAVITLDEAIYCKSKEIQWRNPEEFDNVILRLGGFHTALAFLATIGRCYEESGLEDLLVESSLYGVSTVIQIMKGKSYNRAVRAHKLLMEAMYRLWWKAFVCWQHDQVLQLDQDLPAYEEELTELLQKCHNRFIEGKTTELHTCLDQTDEIMGKIKQSMDDFVKHSSDQSDTFTYWNNYISMVMILLQFIRAERDSDWELHIESLKEMLPYFFAFDRTNYAKWATVYLADMKGLADKAPSVYEEFMAGNHAVKRSAGQFNQVWTDMALEQSVNRDSKTKGGIIGFSTKPGALNRWFVTAHERAAITGAMKTMCGLDENETVDPQITPKESGAIRKQRDERDVEKLISSLSDQMLNPFNTERHQTKSVTNLATGVVASAQISHDLLNAQSIGADLMSQFVDQRLNTNELDFFCTLHKRKLNTFPVLRKVTKAEDIKTASIFSDRQLFSRLLLVGQTREVNLREMFKHELSNVPYSLAYTSECLRKTDKSLLLSELEKDVDVISRLPAGNQSTAWLIDGMAIVRMVKTGGKETFGELSEVLLEIVLSPFNDHHCVRVDVVWDRYDKKDSIKAFERVRRHNTGTIEIKIHGPQTPLPRQWAKFEGNGNNKANFVAFLCNHWQVKAQDKLKPGQQLILAGGFPDGLLVKMITTNDIKSLPSLYSNQEEADTRLLLHAADAAQECSQLVVWSPDTDVAVLCIYCYMQLYGHPKLWFRTGVTEKARFIPVHAVVETLGSALCNVLPAFHAITGCDSTSGFAKIGKSKPWQILMKHIGLYPGLESLGSNEVLPLTDAKNIEAFVCAIYPGKSSIVSVNELRYHLFSHRQSKDEVLPPTYDSLLQHLQRANYQTLVWKHALEPRPELPSPISHGWYLDEKDVMKPKLMTLNPAPKALLEVVTCKCKKSQCQGRCSCSAEGLACIESCLCEGGDECKNPHKMKATTANAEESSEEDSCDEDMEIE